MGIELRLGRVADHDREHPLAPAVVGRADHRHLVDARVAREHVFDFERMDVLAAGHDHVVEPAVDPEIAVVIEVAGVACVVPPVPNRLCVGVGTIPVPLERLVRGDVHADLTRGLSLIRVFTAGRPAQPGLRELVRGRSRTCTPRSSRSDSRTPRARTLPHNASRVSRSSPLPHSRGRTLDSRARAAPRGRRGRGRAWVRGRAM